MGAFRNFGTGSVNFSVDNPERLWYERGAFLLFGGKEASDPRDFMEERLWQKRITFLADWRKGGGDLKTLLH